MKVLVDDSAFAILNDEGVVAVGDYNYRLEEWMKN